MATMKCLISDVEVTFKNGNTKKIRNVTCIDYDSVQGSVVLKDMYARKTIIEREAICCISEE